MGCPICPALFPACRASGFHHRGKHRWLLNLFKEPDQRKLQPLHCSQVPFPVSLSPTAGRTQGATRVCKAKSPKVRERAKDTQPGLSLVPAGHLPHIGRPRTGTAICHICKPGCHAAQCPTWAKATSNPQSGQAQYSLHDMWAAWWYGGDPILGAQLSWPMRSRRSPKVSGM